MPAFYLTFLAVLLVGAGARDQLTIATLSARQNGRPAILVVAALCTVLSCALAGWVAQAMVGELPPPARPIFAAIALGLAGLESLALRVRRAWKEPTHSLGALFLVILGHQVSDAARFLIVGLGVAMAAPYLACGAGALSSLVLVGLAWAMPDFVSHRALGGFRRVAGGVLVAVALYLALAQMRIL
ncbi:hypothetical protein HT136_08290 [Novosphingobium profundi]|uniref:hypothetical protein n=1 Tax=Novosphingobium profundi TaxID=1774954 RepID=UPI001BDAE81F|nr:hypothetical protein [Novosphingobium profundi]MBT0668366.1 hypothetical protein [Novosphingobium profundi]